MPQITGVKILYTNMPKLKMPKTKRQPKYLAPYTVRRITENHIVILSNQLRKKERRIPVEITRPYFERNAPNNPSHKMKKRQTEVTMV